ncbi:MAG TPA: hypothetical protein VFY44_05035 [Thermoleophilaceae bacterium]|nr:hypothetical protein [Thermoleophilaceae bacterium]
MRRILLALTVAAVAGCAPAAQAATVTVAGGTLRVAAPPGEVNAVEVSAGALGSLTIRDTGTDPVAAGACTPTLEPNAVTCPAAGLTRVDADLGDQDDSFSLYAPLPGRVRGGPGDDQLYGGGSKDTLDGGSGADTADGGRGDDRVVMRDRKTDTVACGEGRDRARAEVLDELDVSCEIVDYAPAGRIGSLRARTGGGRFVAVPGQVDTRVDRRILPAVLYLVRRYHLRLGDGYKVGGNHKEKGEHPLGLGLDIYPGAGGSWRQIDKLAKWAEPRQNRPRPPFRWVGYDGDYNHGRGNHLHLSWMHSAGRPGRPVRSVWTWAVSR